jgi:hypothetical protein
METLQIQTKEIITKGKIQVLEFLVKRNNLYVKSPILEEFFKNASVGLNVRTNSEHKEFEVYKIPSIASESRHSISYDNMDSFINQEGYINASFLKVKGISEGVNFKITGVNSKDQVLRFKTEFQKIANEIYREYVKPISHKVEIWTTQEGNLE